MAFSGPSNSGKTTAIVKVASILQDSDFKVCIIKHDPKKDKAMFDREEKTLLSSHKQEQMLQL